MQGTRVGREPLRPALYRSHYSVRMTDRKLALEAWESLFRAEQELFTEMMGEFDEREVSEEE